MRIPVYAICEQQRRRSTCAFAQSDQRLYCSLFRLYNISSLHTCNFMTLAGFFSSSGGFESYLVENPENRFSRDEAQIRTARSNSSKKPSDPPAQCQTTMLQEKHPVRKINR